MYIFLKEKQSKEKIRHTQQSRETKPLRVKLFSCNVLISAKLLEEHFRVNEANRSKPKLCLLFCAYFLAGKNDFKPNSQRRKQLTIRTHTLEGKDYRVGVNHTGKNNFTLSQRTVRVQTSQNSKQIKILNSNLPFLSPNFPNRRFTLHLEEEVGSINLPNRNTWCRRKLLNHYKLNPLKALNQLRYRQN